MRITETNLGFLVETNAFTVLFGGTKALLGNLQASFEDIQFVRVKQTHGDKSVLSNDPALDYRVEADAHFTQRANLGLCISTADCMPIFIYDQKSQYVAGIHAGWRGVANNIVPKTIDRLKSLGGSPEQMRVLIGPHIQMSSFEVDFTVRDEILSSISETATLPESIYHTNLNSEKALVDLNQVMKTQLQVVGISFDHLSNLHIDTFTDPRFHSHRREKEQAGRQLSFIFKK